MRSLYLFLALTFGNGPLHAKSMKVPKSGSSQTTQAMLRELGWDASSFGQEQWDRMSDEVKSTVYNHYKTYKNQFPGHNKGEWINAHTKATRCQRSLRRAKD